MIMAALAATCATCLALDTTLLASTAHAQTGPSRLVFEITGLKPIEGQLRTAVFCDPAGYKRFKPDLAQTTPVTKERLIVVFETPPTGSCAALLHHDVDGDGAMAQGLFGLPREPVAASRQARFRFGPPRFADASFAVGPSETRQKVRFGGDAP
jgi:uncharacterized protein (DUF2141 family)